MDNIKENLGDDPCVGMPSGYTAYSCPDTVPNHDSYNQSCCQPGFTGSYSSQLKTACCGQAGQTNNSVCDNNSAQYPCCNAPLVCRKGATESNTSICCNPTDSVGYDSEGNAVCNGSYQICPGAGYGNMKLCQPSRCCMDANGDQQCCGTSEVCTNGWSSGICCSSDLTGTCMNGFPYTCNCCGSDEYSCNGVCCPSAQNSNNNACYTDFYGNGMCSCPSNNATVNASGQCVCNAPDQVMRNGACMCKYLNAIMTNNVCSCPVHSKLNANSECVCSSNATFNSNGECECPFNSSFDANGNCV